MAFDFTQFRQQESPPVELHPSPITSNFPGWVLAFDQSLSKTGWALIRGGEVIDTGTLSTEPKGRKGHEANLHRTVELHRLVEALIEHHTPAMVVHESPPVGGRMMRPESSLLAAAAIRIAVETSGIEIRMVGAQRAKKRFTGNGNADKRVVKDSLIRMYPSLPEAFRLNEAIVDAIVLGLVAVEDQHTMGGDDVEGD